MNADKEYLQYVDDLIQHPEVLKLKEIKHHVFSNRYSHSVQVSYISYRTAKRMGFSEDSIRSIARGALLHDLFHDTREEIERLGTGSHNYVHPQIALENALEITDLCEVERDIISKHMFLCTSLKVYPKYKESLLVSLADKWVAILDVVPPVKRLSKNMMVNIAY